MHDPMVVAFEIPFPIPRRTHYEPPSAPRWGITRSRRTNDENRGEPTYPWWRPAGYTTHIAGRAYGLRHLITVWHVEPGGRDALTVCGRHADGSRDFRNRWRWHAHHWKIQVSPLQRLRRALLTRCEECGRRGSPNFSHQWDGERGPWWRGEQGLYHSECSSLVRLRDTLKDADHLTFKILDAYRVTTDMSRDEALYWFGGDADSRNIRSWRATYRLRKQLDDQEVATS